MLQMPSALPKRRAASFSSEPNSTLSGRQQPVACTPKQSRKRLRHEPEVIIGPPDAANEPILADPVIRNIQFHGNPMVPLTIQLQIMAKQARKPPFLFESNPADLYFKCILFLYA